MDKKQSLRWAGYYLALSTLSAVVGLVFVGAAVVLSLDVAYLMYRESGLTMAVLETAAPGLASVVVGFLLWKLGKAAAFYKTMTGAVDEQMETQFDSEKVKSDILAVLDDRLSDMQYEVERTRQSVEEMERKEKASEFQFDN